MLASQETDKAPQSTHLVQCYQSDEGMLIENAARFLKEGIELGHCIFIIATPSHRTGFLRELKRIGAISQPHGCSGGIILLDAADTLVELTVDGEPSAARFDQIIGATIREAAGRSGSTGIHAYGDMVGLLWEAKRYAAAAKLEGFWNDLRRSIDFDLFCGYPLGVFDEAFEASAVDALLRAHTHVVPSTPNGDLEDALHRAFAEIAGAHDAELSDRMKEIHHVGWASMPDAEAMILWLRESMPDKAPSILARAEQYYRLSA